MTTTMIRVMTQASAGHTNDDDDDNVTVSRCRQGHSQQTKVWQRMQGTDGACDMCFVVCDMCCGTDGSQNSNENDGYIEMSGWVFGETKSLEL